MGLCASRGISTCHAIDGEESRIGANDGNPSHGHCLHEDVEQLSANHKDAPRSLIRAIVDDDRTPIRAKFCSRETKLSAMWEGRKWIRVS